MDIDTQEITTLLSGHIEKRWPFSDKPKVFCDGSLSGWNRYEVTASFEFKLFTLSAKVEGSVNNAEVYAGMFYSQLNVEYAKALESYLNTLVDVTRSARTFYNGVEMTAVEYATKRFMRENGLRR